MHKTKKLVAGLGMAAIAALSVHAGLSAEVASGTKDDFLTPKNQNAASDPFESFQKRFESMFSQPFFQDPSLDNLKGFDLFDRNLNEHFDKMLKSLGAPGIQGLNAPLFNSLASTEDAKTDIREIDDKLMVKIDLPGVEKEAIDLKVKNNRLIISSERKQQSSSSDDKGKVYRNEVSYGSFSRVIELPRKVIEDKIEANYENGVLTVTAEIDKTAPAPEDNGRSIKIN